MNVSLGITLINGFVNGDERKLEFTMEETL